MALRLSALHSGRPLLRKEMPGQLSIVDPVTSSEIEPATFRRTIYYYILYIIVLDVLMGLVGASASAALLY
jgi:hypothetical protein